MNTSALKTFAPAVRQQLMEAVMRKLDFVLTAQTPDYLTTFAPQVASLRKLAQADRAGLIDRVAYTWFNRSAALRFMDARGWHPFRARVLTPASAEETQPELLKLTRTGALPEVLKTHTAPTRLNDLLDGRIPSPDAQGEVYRHLVLAACRFYHALLPNLFEKLDDETELLLPDDLLTEHSVVHGFRTEISDEDCSEVEVLGWLYQFYISERKDQVMARKSAVPTEDIPAVTQLFTPHWIVRYLVENSLGRLWLLNRPGSRLREHMPYYIEGEKNATGGSPDDFLKITKPEEIRLCDPAVGSGHMLTYAFDLLTLIYEEEGYAPSEIPALILRHNLHGLEICPRAAQLAELALVFKAREKSRRFFQPEHLVRPRIIELRDVRFAENELRDYIHALGLGDLFNQSVVRLLHQFEEAKNFGSLIQPCLDEGAIADVRRAIEAKDLGGQLFLRETHLKVLRVLEQAEALTQRYHVVVANPPYMGTKGMNGRLAQFAKDSFPNSKFDLFSMFIERNIALTLKGGLTALITMQSWMFLSSYNELRESLIGSIQFSSMLHLGPRGFDSISGEVVQTVAFVFNNCAPTGTPSVFFRLIEGTSEEKKSQMFFETAALQTSPTKFVVSQANFSRIPGHVVAYWLSHQVLEAFSHMPPLAESISLRKGLTTMNNGRFLRFWHEVAASRTKLDAPDSNSARLSKARWFPVLKGGGSRRWFGLNDYLINWENDGEELKSFISSIYNGGSYTKEIRSEDQYFKPSITWSTLTSDALSMRLNGAGSIFESKGSVGLARSQEELLGGLAFCNSVVAGVFLNALSPTLDYNAGPVSRVPYANPQIGESARIATSCVSIARADWDNFETSWDFRDQPLLRPGLKGATLEASWRNWEAQSTAAIRRMQELEKENNRLFIAAYGLDGELKPEVPEEQITLLCNPASRYVRKAKKKKGNDGESGEAENVEIPDEQRSYTPEQRSLFFRADTIREFLSYAVGCMMGRYSLDQPGLILANAGDTVAEYLAKVGKLPEALTFPPDEDGIIPVLDGEWFEDDIVARTRDFLRATFGEATLRENLRFIEDSLGKDLRKYFLNDFYKDHLQTYKKRPIYWLVQSPKKGFSVLLYLHRYTRDTMNLVLNRYLRDYLTKLRNRLPHLAQEQATASTAKAKTEARKEADKLTKILHECEEWERQTLLPLAQARIELDLDDGVKVNYLKLGEALAPIPGLAAKEED